MLYEFSCNNPKCNNQEIIEEIMTIKESEENPPKCPDCKLPMKRHIGKADKNTSWGLWAASDNAGRKR